MAATPKQSLLSAPHAPRYDQQGQGQLPSPTPATQMAASAGAPVASSSPSASSQGEEGALLPGGSGASSDTLSFRTRASSLSHRRPLLSPDDSHTPALRPSPPAAVSLCSRSTPRLFQLQWASWFALGCINNMSYVVVNSAAKSIAESFGQGDLIGAVVWANVAFGIGARFLNTFALLNTPVSLRVSFNCLLMLLGTLGLAGGTMVSFWLCLVAVISVGCFSSLGESVLLGYLREFDPAFMGAWSSGTGMAGILGTLTYLLLYSVLGLSNRTIFLLQAPFVVVYWAGFRFVAGSVVPEDLSAGQQQNGPNNRLTPESSRKGSDAASAAGVHVVVKMPAQADAIETSVSVSGSPSLEQQERERLHAPTEQHALSITSPAPTDAPLSSPTSGLSARPRAGSSVHLWDSDPPDPSVHGEDSVGTGSPAAGEGEGEGDGEGDGANGEYETLEQQEFFAQEKLLDRTIRVGKHVSSPAIQLAAVYFFEYVVLIGFASKANPNADKDDWWASNAFELLAFCYQIGVFISRSSVSVIQIRRIELLTIAQALQFILWWIHATHHFLPLWVQFADMIFVGLLGGGMYVNVFYLLVKDRTLRKQDRELGINLTAIGINVGIVLSSVLEIILFTTVLKDKDD